MDLEIQTAIPREVLEGVVPGGLAKIAARQIAVETVAGSMISVSGRSPGPSLAVENHRGIKPAHLFGPDDEFPIVQPWECLAAMRANSWAWPSGRPTRAGLVLDVVDAHWFAQNLLTKTGVVRGIT